MNEGMYFPGDLSRFSALTLKETKLLPTPQDGMGGADLGNFPF